MSLKLHSNQYPNHLQIPRIHKIAETRLIPLSTRGGQRGGVGKQMWWWQLNFYTKDLLHSILYCLLQSKICPATESPTANWVPVFSPANKNKWISRILPPCSQFESSSENEIMTARLSMGTKKGS
jgi:hypothetical protein